MLKNTPENYKKLQAFAKDCNALGTPYTFTAYSFSSVRLNELHLYIDAPESYLHISADDNGYDRHSNSLGFAIKLPSDIYIGDAIAQPEAQKLAKALALASETVAKAIKLAKKHGIAVTL